MPHFGGYAPKLDSVVNMGKSSVAVQRTVARTLRKRNDPHGKSITDPSSRKISINIAL